MNKYTALIVDNDKKFISLVKRSIDMTDNIHFAGSAENLDELKKTCKQFIPSLILINIDLPNSEAVRILNFVKESRSNVLALLMNIDGKKFGEFKSDNSQSDGFIEKSLLFDEIKNLSKFLKNSAKVKDYSFLLEADSK